MLKEFVIENSKVLNEENELVFDLCILRVSNKQLQIKSHIDQLALSLDLMSPGIYVKNVFSSDKQL